MKRLFQTDWSKDRDKLDKRARNDAQEEASIIPTDVFPSNPSTSLHGSNTVASRGADELTTSSSSPIGVSVLYNPSDGNAAVDIVFIHGLKGHREKTWTSDKASEPWPKALLPSEIPNARVLAYGYDADVAKATEMVSVSRIRDHAATFLKRLTNFRDRTDSSARPIIFVCHSLGGLVCQAALARAHTREHLKEVLEATRGILFLGTPHHGSALAVWAERLGKSVGVLKQTNTEILGVLRPESEVLAEIQDNFHNITQSQTKAGVGTIQITCFYEELPLPGIGLVVPQHSAIFPGKDAVGIHGTHHTMVKFSSLEDSGFIDICDELRTWIKKFDRKVPVPQRQSTPPPAVEEQNEKRSTTPQKKTASKFLVPYAKNKSFVERSNVFERLKSEFCHGPEDDVEDARSRVCLYGLGGIGKTQIAIAYTYWLRKAHPEVSIFWVHASDSDRFRQAYSEIAEECNIAGRSDHNVDVLTLQNSPKYGNGSVLVITRNKEAGSRLVPGQPLLEVGPMSDEESVQMIREIAGDSSLSVDTATVLSNRLENLPLAIAQAAAFMQENCMGLDQYIGILNKGDGVEVQLLRGNFEAVGRDTDVPHAVMATWVVSFEHIKKKNPLAADILSVIAFFDRQAIQRQLMTIHMYLLQYRTKSRSGNESDDSRFSSEQDKAKHCQEYSNSTAEFQSSNAFEDDSTSEIYNLSEDHTIKYPGDPYQSLEVFERDGAYSIILEQALGTLKAFSFIKENKNGTLSMHRLVQLATADWLNRKGSARDFIKIALVTLNKFSSAFDNAISLSYKTVSHYQAILAADAENRLLNSYLTSVVASKMVRFYMNALQPRLALHYIEATLENLDHNQQKLPFQRARRLKAVVLRVLDREQEAKQTLIELATTQPQDSQVFPYATESLAELFLESGDYIEARDLLIGAIMQLEKNDALSLRQNACLMVYLGTAFYKLGESEKAEETFLQVLSTVKEALASGKATNFDFVYEVALAFASQGKLQEAETMFRQLLSNELDSAESPAINIRILGALADVLREQGRDQEAIDIHRQVVHLSKHIKDFQSRYRAKVNALQKLAKLQTKQKSFGDAEESIAHALLLHQGIHGDTGWPVLQCTFFLGVIKCKLGKWEEAKNMMEKAYQHSVDAMGSNHELTHDFKSVLDDLSELIRSVGL
ncbi:hypothetical protein CSPX01_11442 [Colletotrichum filicis]|nr:hypothetical protein CSPX01_11442 [Colletotrichum filicis]